MEIKDYKMEKNYAIDNFLGLSLDEQEILLNDLRNFSLSVDDEWLSSGFEYVFFEYYRKIKDIVYSLKRYPKLRDDIKMLFRINKSRDFNFDFLLNNPGYFKRLDDNLEFSINGNKYLDNYDMNNKSYTNPDRIYLQDISLENDDEKEEFATGMVQKYRDLLPKNRGILPLPERVIELYDPILLDIYGEDIFNYIKSIHHSFNIEVINYIARFMPYNTDNDYNYLMCDRKNSNRDLEIVNEMDHSLDEYFKIGNKAIVLSSNRTKVFETYEEELDYVRSLTYKKINLKVNNRSDVNTYKELIKTNRIGL